MQEVIKTADWILDLGPEGGDKGDEIVAEGTPEDVAKEPRSYTGQYLTGTLAKSDRAAASPAMKFAKARGAKQSVRRLSERRSRERVFQVRCQDFY